MKGFVILPRDFSQNECFNTSEPFDRSRAFIDLVIHASHKRRVLTLRKAETLLEEGEMITSLRALCRRWHRSLGYVIKTLKAFSEGGMITRKPEKRATIIRIADWKRYQGLQMLLQTPETPETEKDENRDTINEQTPAQPDSLENEPKAEENSPSLDTSQPGSETDFNTKKDENCENIQKCFSDKKIASAEARALANLLLSEILKNDPYMKPPKEGDWKKKFFNMITYDKIPPEVLRDMIKFSQKNSYWMQLIICPVKIKVHFHKLFLNMKEDEKKNSKLTPTSERYYFEN